MNLDRNFDQKFAGNPKSLGGDGMLAKVRQVIKSLDSMMKRKTRPPQ
jgi:hypothetical protein